MNFSVEVDMDKKVAGLVGAISSLGAMNTVEASAAQNAEVLSARSYAELVQPIPNAVALLKAAEAADAARAMAAERNPNVRLAQYWGHHHHHHHRYYHHHHHHHHHHHRHGYYPYQYPYQPYQYPYQYPY
jgi:G3E family GTPase